MSDAGLRGAPVAHPRPPVLRPGRPGRRLVATGVACLLGLGAVAVRVGELQLVDGSELIDRGENSRTNEQVLAADRGVILDRHHAELALSIDQWTVWIDPKEVRAWAEAEGRPLDEVARTIADAAGVDEARVADALADGDRRFAYIRRMMTDAERDRVLAVFPDADGRRSSSGVGLIIEPKRVVPAAEIGATIIGRTDIDGVGTAGIELQYDAVLTGTPGRLVREAGADGATIAAGRRQVVPARDGDDLRLTIDLGLQYNAEQILRDAVVRAGAKGGIVIVADPRTGEILAMANVDTDPETGQAVVARRNRAVVDIFEPGSTNKVITMAAALEEGILGTDTVVQVPESVTVGDKTYADSHPVDDPVWTATEILARSSNVGTIRIAQALGSETVHAYLLRFGLGERTALAFPHEAKGIVKPLAAWYGSERASIPIGQGVSVTALQMLDVFNIVANDGVLAPPRLVLDTIGADGTARELPGPEPVRIISADTAAQLRSMLAEVVGSADGTGRRASIPGYSVAGKTGTARKPQDNGSYIDEAGKIHYVASFAGFVPAADPRLSAIVVIDEPSSTIYGGDTAAPVFAQVMQIALSDAGIRPDAAGATALAADAPAVARGVRPGPQPGADGPSVATPTTGRNG